MKEREREEVQWLYFLVPKEVYLVTRVTSPIAFVWPSRSKTLDPTRMNSDLHRNLKWMQPFSLAARVS